MAWRKLGKIWETDHQRSWMVSHSALPIAEALGGNAYRIYFSTRNEKNQSQIASFDLDLTTPHNPLAVCEKPLVSPGPLGAYDDSGVTSSCLVSEGGHRRLYYTGWSLGVTVPFYFEIGMSLEEPGAACWKKPSYAPVLGKNEHDPFLLASPFILVEQGLWRMWYVAGVKWELEAGQPKHYYHIRYAESTDGLHWMPAGRVCIDFASPGEYAIARPCVLKEEGLYKMWYSYRGDVYQLGYAESTDGLHWRRLDEQAGLCVSDAGWDSEMICYPYVFAHQGQKYMLYNGNQYGKSGIGLAIWES